MNHTCEWILGRRATTKRFLLDGQYIYEWNKTQEFTLSIRCVGCRAHAKLDRFDEESVIDVHPHGLKAASRLIPCKAEHTARATH